MTVRKSSGGIPVLHGSGAPSETPAYQGQVYIDDDTGRIYISVATDGSYNWAYIGIGLLEDFTKDSVVGLSFWVKADTGVTYDGGNAVSQWTDQSDSGWHLAQANAANKPLYVENIINGYPVIRFDGINDYIYNNSPVLAQPYTVFIVGKYIANPDGDYIVDGGINCDILNTGGGCFRTYAGTTLGTTPSDTNNHIWTIVHNGATSHIMTDETEISGNAGATAISDIYVGANQAPGNYANGNIAEILIYNSDLSDANRTIVLAYLNNKYAIY